MLMSQRLICQRLCTMRLVCAVAYLKLCLLLMCPRLSLVRLISGLVGLVRLMFVPAVRGVMVSNNSYLKHDSLLHLII
ncbi:hypothetical protein RchiOBHm_Chr1g0347261 [Rosa chinensis]|uniref:Uncharacterized protein n=1 Tax=Rosa chinensis TaxID=74649 RepID=A0A2P6SF87_ROSCH|nr:hypothetical protein RchiOBHm_Chr1g0347261 [Rosa chinensis]